MTSCARLLSKNIERPAPYAKLSLLYIHKYAGFLNVKHWMLQLSRTQFNHLFKHGKDDHTLNHRLQLSVSDRPELSISNRAAQASPMASSTRALFTVCPCSRRGRKFHSELSPRAG